MAEPFLGFTRQQGVRFTKNSGYPFRERAFGQGGPPIERLCFGSVLAGEPVITLTEKVVAHFRPLHQAERLRVHPEPEDFADVDLTGHVQV